MRTYIFKGVIIVYAESWLYEISSLGDDEVGVGKV